MGQKLVLLVYWIWILWREWVYGEDPFGGARTWCEAATGVFNGAYR